MSYNFRVDETGASVTRWRRYGKDRLYVRAADDADLGWWDLTTDQGHPVDGHADAVSRAVAAWKVAAGWQPPVPVAADEPEPEPAPEPEREPEPESESAPGAATAARPAVERPWVDLAGNRAGEAARDRAEAEQLAAPVRTMFARVLGVHTNERAWRIGADGEEKVAAKLAKLARRDPRWRFLHAIPVGVRGSDIDHLVIGPGGVFTINTKHHPGAKIWVGGNTFLVDGHKQPYIRNARHEAKRAADLLTAACGSEVHVEGVIATVNAGDIVVKGQPVGVTVVPRMQVGRWLGRHGDVLDEERIEQIYDAARRSTTWRP